MTACDERSSHNCIMPQIFWAFATANENLTSIIVWILYQTLVSMNFVFQNNKFNANIHKFFEVCIYVIL